jgi:NAD(P)-dependent dehydrogenase (short-subunit alcohol dehydrogenase family)
LTLATGDRPVALVTGAGKGLGAACARRLAADGFHVVAMSRSRQPLDALQAAIADAGGRATALPCDVTDAASVRAAIAGLPRVDVLVNNAGTNRPRPLVDVDDAVLAEQLDLNVRAAIVVAQAVVRKMLARGTKGSIINMSSQMGHVGAPGRTVYCATKHALEGFTKALAVELAPHGIRVNTVAPSFVETPMTADFFRDAAFRTWVLDRIPMGRLAALDEVAAAVAFLASPASAFTTGSSLRVDGGWTAQ